jgi:hypothetical protein
MFSFATLGTPAQAAFLDVPVPANAYITFGGLQWAWANPLPAGDELLAAFQGSQGWRLPTAQELLNAPLASQFLFVGANTPFQGSDPVSGALVQATNAAYDAAQSAGACATPYFSSSFHHCDWQDGLGQPFGPWNGMPGAASFADQLYVRNAGPAVPEPATWAMLLSGFALAGFALRRRPSAAFA